MNDFNWLRVKQDDSEKESCVLSKLCLDKYRSNVNQVSKDKVDRMKTLPSYSAVFETFLLRNWWKSLMVTISIHQFLPVSKKGLVKFEIRALHTVKSRHVHQGSAVSDFAGGEDLRYNHRVIRSKLCTYCCVCLWERAWNYIGPLRCPTAF